MCCIGSRLYNESPQDAVDDSTLRTLLHAVDLEYLINREREGYVNWGDVLSLGEQQRLGMARLFYHKPRFAILDECTSGVTVEMEQRFCNAVKEMGCTCITISHRPALVAFHDVVLALDGDGGWRLHAGKRAIEAGTAESWADGALNGSCIHTVVVCAGGAGGGGGDHAGTFMQLFIHSFIHSFIFTFIYTKIIVVCV